MYSYRNAYHARDQRFIGWGFGLPLVGGLVGGLLGSALFYPRPFYGGYPPYPGYGYPGVGYPGYGGYPYFY